jgi:hypothetical protein
MAEIRDGNEVHAEQVAMIASAVASASATAATQMSAAEAFLGGGVGSAAPGGFAEAVTPGAADPPD